MTFDVPDEPLHLDSVYPAGCWQVGHPNKPVFTSAYSEPNALVTDTLFPHLDSTTCYAQFTMIADDEAALGKQIRFNYWSDMDSLQSFGWIEKQNSYTYQWSRLPISDAYYVWFENSGEILTDSGAVFTGRTNGWRSASILLECMGVFHDDDQDRGGGWSDTMRLRFAFRGAPNSAGFDGWMIDDVEAIPLMCIGGTEEFDQQEVLLLPNPADDHVRFGPLPFEGSIGDVGIFTSDGRAVRSARIGSSNAVDLDTKGLPNGVYTVRVLRDREQMTRRLIVQH